MNQKEFSRPLSLERVKITDPFWVRKSDLVREQMIPYQWAALNDQLEDAEPSYCMRNFEVAARQNQERREKGDDFTEPEYTFRGFQSLPDDPEHLEETFYGFVFQDSDLYKWIEAAAYSLAQHPDQKLEALVDHAIDLVCRAQQEDGYLNTYYILNGKDRIFTNLKDHHELYCFGHLAEGAVAYYEATGKEKLLQAAMRYADYIAGYFGKEEGKCKGYPGHEIAEMALIRLYETTGREEYLRLAEFFIEQRGQKPYYFDTEQREQSYPEQERDGLRYMYQQAHLPVREQTEAVGHAVRAVYLYSGMADLARVRGDASLYGACERLWNNIVREKLYITGGIGATHVGEAFSFGYDLPNDTAYAETCASIGLVFFARRMLQLRASAVYADVMELALYNGILSGMSLDGRSFFYVNPLECVPAACDLDERKSHVKAVRQKWFGCACCPPNLARLISSLGAYAYTERENILFVHLYLGAAIQKKIDGQSAVITVDSKFPWEGDATVSVSGCDREFTVALRIPGWCGGEYRVEGADGAVREERDGYLYVTKVWREGDRLRLHFPMQVKKMAADDRVREDIGKAAVMRGPIVYCLEERDNGEGLHMLQIAEGRPDSQDGMRSDGTEQKKGAPKAERDCGKPVETGLRDCDIAGEPVKAILLKGFRLRGEKAEGLYYEYRNREREKTTLFYIPYYTWANRGENEMQVWTPVCSDCDADARGGFL